MKLATGCSSTARARSRATHTDVTYDERIVDAVCMQLVMFPEQIRRTAASEPLRRHRLGSLRRTGRRAGRRAGREHGHGVGGLRSGSRQRARHRQQEHGEPDGPAAVGAVDARLHRRTQRMASAFVTRSAARADPTATSSDARHGRNGRARRSSPTPICAAKPEPKFRCSTTSRRPCWRARMSPAICAGDTGNRSSTPASGSTPTSTSCGRRSATRSTAR